MNGASHWLLSRCNSTQQWCSSWFSSVESFMHFWCWLVSWTFSRVQQHCLVLVAKELVANVSKWLPCCRYDAEISNCLIRVTHIVLICSLFFFLLSLPFCILGRNFPTTFRYCDKIVSSNHPLKPQGRGGKNTTTTKNTFFLLRARQSCVNVSWPHCSTVCWAAASEETDI